MNQPASIPANNEGYNYEAAMPSLNIDFRRIFAAVYRNRFIAAGIVAVAVALAIAYSLTTTPIYQATATLQIDSQAAEVLDTGSSADPRPDWDTERFLQTQLDVLLSRGTAEKVVDRLNLTKDNTYFERMQIPAPQAPAAGKTMAETRKARIVDSLIGNLSAELPRYSRVVQVTFTSPDASYAATIANAYLDAFITANLQRKFDSSAYARQYLEQQLALAKDRLEQSEQAQVAYARKIGLVDLQPEQADGTAGSSSSLVVTNLVSVNSALNQARTERIAAEEAYRVAQGGSAMSIPQVQNSGFIQSLQQQRASVAADMARDSERYKSDHPVMQEYRRRLEGIDAQINRAVADVRGSLRQQFEAARRNEDRLEAQVNSLRSGTEVEQSERVQYNILAREASTNRAMYDALLQRYKEVSASAGVSTNNISIVDRAMTPGGPIRPRPMINFLLGLIAGLFLAAAYIIAKEILHDATRTPDDVTERLGLPFLGSVPKLDADETIVEELENPKSSVSESFAALRTSLGLLSTEGLRNMLVTSSQQSEGKSLVAYGVGRSYVREGKKVLLVDADLRRPSQHHIQGVSREIGLTNILTRQIDWRDAVQTNSAGLDLIPAGPLPPSVPELLSSASFMEFRDAAMAAYDVVIFDGPPVLGLADTILLAQRIEHLIFVTEAGRATHGGAQAAIRRLRANDIHIDGAVLNKFDPKQSGYGYEYGYYYSYGRDAT
ncbi:MAG: polysaccharide biosynthesis tyrosine autokinase [Sphingomonadales bacterium]|nr:polysaccharide biosynthesis tyrosine autokinase [Sphingomonadales bacterium]MBD3774789.1 polysaccharide biosynthesis tyrosine autokinase [Paracoccaceae bacterium]